MEYTNSMVRKQRTNITSSAKHEVFQLHGMSLEGPGVNILQGQSPVLIPPVLDDANETALVDSDKDVAFPAAVTSSTL